MAALDTRLKANHVEATHRSKGLAQIPMTWVVNLCAGAERLWGDWGYERTDN